MASFDIDSFLLAVMDRHHITSLLNPLRCTLRSILRSLIPELRELIERLLERRSHSIPLEQRYPKNEILFGFGLGRQSIQVHHHREVIAGFRCHDVGPVLPLQHFLSAILDELAEAFDGDGDEDFGFGFRRREVEGYAIEVGDDLVD
jgi:hypothetical protein